MNKIKVTLGICFLIIVVIGNIVLAQNNIINENTLNEIMTNDILTDNNVNLEENDNITEEISEEDNRVIKENNGNIGALQNIQSNVLRSEQYLEDGTYEILSVINTNIAFDITDGSNQNGAKIQLWDNIHAVQQRFILEYDQTDGYYRIKSKKTGKYLSVQNIVPDWGSNVTQEDLRNDDTQKWYLKEQADGVYSILSKCSNLAIDLPDWNCYNGVKPQLWGENDTSTAQQFIFSKIEEGTKNVEEGTYEILSAINTNIAFDITDGSNENGAKIQLWENIHANQQKFILEYQSEGYYKIKNKQTGKYLSVQGIIPDWGSNVTQEDVKEDDTQLWQLKKRGDNVYSIVSKCDNLAIDLPDWNCYNGVKPQLWGENANSTAQQFIFSKIEEGTKNVEEGTYEIFSVINKNISFDITDGSNANGTKIQLWQYVGAEQQKFNFIYVSEGYYKIQSKLTGKYLSVQSVVPDWGSNITQEDERNDDTQLWKLKKQDENVYSIISKCGNLAIDLPDWNCYNGIKPQLWGENDSSTAQQFYLNIRNDMQPEKTIEDGMYKIVTKINSNQAFDITDGSYADGAQIQLWQYVNSLQQLYDIKCGADNYYTITSKITGKVLAVENANVYNGVKVIQQTATGADTEKWIIKDNGDGTYSLISKCNNYYIDIPNGDISNGIKLQMYEQNGTDSQKFLIQSIKGFDIIEEGTYRIAASSKEILSFDIDCGYRDNGANLQLWDWVGETSYQQQFNIKYNTDGSYTIINLNSGKALDVQNGGYAPGTNVWQYEQNNTDAQKWILQKNDNGTYSFISKLNNLYLNISGEPQNGSNIEVNTESNTSNQQFILYKQTTKAERYLDDGIYRIATKLNNSLGFDIQDGSTQNGANIQLWQYVAKAQEEFKVQYENGYYYIISQLSDKVLQVGQNNLIEQQDKDESNDLQKWRVIPDGTGAYNIINKANGLYMDVKDALYQNGNKIQVTTPNGNIAQLFQFIDVSILIDENRYPGIKEMVYELKNKHPNWQFEVLYTGINFYTAVQGEYEYYSVDKYGNKHPANLVDTNVYKGAWIAPNPIVSGNWAQASYNGIAYFMDPRNFLNDTDVFQFVDLTDYYNSGATLTSIQYEVNGTFLNNFAEDVRVSCERQNVNPYYIIARLFQEQGRQGSSTIYMNGGDGKQYFNPFNIGAVVGNDVATALERAKQYGWDTMQKGIEGGIGFIKQEYLDAHQNTLYLNKFDVNPNSPGQFYSHQYMQNLSAAYSEARKFRSSYVNTGTLDNTIKFIIPVYENMPTQPAGRPTEHGGVLVTDQGPKSVQIINTSVIIRDGPGMQYAEIETLQNGTTMLSVERYDNGWQKVVLSSGKVGYCYGGDLQFIPDITNCNERVAIQTNTEVNVRIGPGTSFSSLGMFGNGTTGTRILKGVYQANGYTWDLVIFDNGVKGFVATNYLRLL